MTNPVIQPSFGAGELSPSLFGRVDLAKYRSGVQVARNMFVDYRGGLSTRSGTAFVALGGDMGNPIRLLPFQFSTLANYMLEFGQRYMRVHQDGAPLLNPDGSIYSIPTPYAAVDLPLLKFTQSADVLTLTHPAYPPLDLTRSGSAAPYVFALVPAVFAVVTAAPTITNVQDQVGGTTTYRYVATATASDTGEESLASAPMATTTAAIMSQDGNEFCTVIVAPQPNIALWNFYRQQESPNAAPDISSLYGFVGSSTGLVFQDHNGVPDFTKTPPLPADPFANGQITSITVTDGGSGYDATTTIGITDPTGAGFSGFPVLGSGGSILSIAIQSGGFNYTAPVLAISGPGTGAAIASVASTTGAAFVANLPTDYQAPQGPDAGGSEGAGF